MSNREVYTKSPIIMWLLTRFAGYTVLNRRLTPRSARFRSMRYIKVWRLGKGDDTKLR